MTQEEIQQKAYEVYPLDLDRHLIIEGEPYDNNKEKREAYIKGLIDSKLSIPSNLDEAAKKYELSIGSQDYCYLDIEDAFKAGAEWMSGQGAINYWMAKDKDGHLLISNFKPYKRYTGYLDTDSSKWINISPTLSRELFPDIKLEDDPIEVAVQIRKKEK